MFPGNGFRIANDVLTDISYVLVEPVVSIPLGAPVAGGAWTLTPSSMTGIYDGAQLVAGVPGGNLELLTVANVTATTFDVTFQNAHLASEVVSGATFPLAPQDSTHFFTQEEMLEYLSNAQNRYLTACPFLLNTATQIFNPGIKVSGLPADAVQLERVAVNGVSLHEQGKVGLDWIDYRWPSVQGRMPQVWFEDRVNFFTYGVAPIPGNTFATELYYARRDSDLLQLHEGFLLPDPFLTYLKYLVLAQCFGKEGEMRDPARARYCEQRYELGVQIGRKVYDNIQTQEVVSPAPVGGISIV